MKFLIRVKVVIEGYMKLMSVCWGKLSFQDMRLIHLLN